MHIPIFSFQRRFKNSLCKTLVRTQKYTEYSKRHKGLFSTVKATP